MSIKLIHELHAAISRRDWTATEAAANSLRDDIDVTVKVLAGPNIGSMPNDYPISRLASDVELDRRERVRQCDIMAKDWADFCETMGAKWDTQEAVAQQLKAIFNKKQGKWRVFESVLDRTHFGIELEDAGNDDDPILYSMKIKRETVQAIVDAHNEEDAMIARAEARS